MLVNKVYNNSNNWYFLMLWSLAVKSNWSFRPGIRDFANNNGLKMLK
jgi:hypothetical protein